MNEKSSAVLIIEDQAEMADLVAAVLHGAGYWPIVAADGEEGLHLAREHLPALILCDASLPLLSGVEVVAALRSGARTGTLPIVMMSGKASSELAGCGADALLPKPFQMKELISAVRSFVPEHPAWSEDVAGELTEQMA